MSSLRSLFSLLIIVCFTAFLVICMGCSDSLENTPQISTAQEAPHPGGIYTTPLLQNQTTLDPVNVTEHYGVAVVNQLFDGLVRLDDNLLLHPALASSWTVSESGTTYTFFLRPGVLFHDGTPVKATDIIFTLKRLLRHTPPTIIQPHLLLIEGAESYRDGKTETLSGITTKDDATLIVTLKQPDAGFLVALSMYQAKIVPEHCVQGHESEFGRTPIGTGPFSLSSWEQDRSINLKRFEPYFGHPAWLDQVVFRIYPGGNSDQILKDFKSGELDEMPVYGDAKTALADMPDLNWVRRTSLSVLFYGIRTTHPALKDPRIRRALSLAIDRKKLVHDIYNDQFEPALSILPPGMPGHLKVASDFTENLNTAKHLINEATHGDPASIGPIEIVCSVKSQFSTKELAFIQSSWEKLGLTIHLKYITSSWGDFKDYLKTNQAAVHRRAIFADLPDPDSFLTPLVSSKGAFNAFDYANPQIDQMLKTAGQTQDPQERAKKYQDIERLLAQKMPLIPLCYLSVERVYKPYVRGVNVTALDQAYVSLADFWLDKTTH